jgi:hypothetical protein
LSLQGIIFWIENDIRGGENKGKYPMGKGKDPDPEKPSFQVFIPENV